MTCTRIGQLALAVLIALNAPCAFAVSLVGSGAAVIRPIAVTGLANPALPANVTFSDFVNTASNGDLNAPAFNNAGDSAFFAVLAGAGVTTMNESSLWAERGGSLVMLAREGDPAPGAPAGIVFASLRSHYPALSDNGTIIFGAEVRNAAQQLSQGVWRADSAGVTLLALENELLPANSNIRVQIAIDDYRVNSQGDAALWLRQREVSSGILRDGIYRFRGAGVAPIVETGRPAVGAAGTLVNVLQQSFAMNDGGQVAYVGQFQGAGVAEPNDTAIWIGNGGSQTLIVREGNPAPGALPGTIFRDISQGTPFADALAFNGSVQLSFRARLSGSALVNRYGAWTYSGSGVNLRMIDAVTPAPELPGVLLATIQGENYKPVISMNDGGAIAFISSLTGAVTDDSDLAVLRDRGMGLELVARSGDLAPGAPAGSVFYEFDQGPQGLGAGTPKIASPLRHCTAIPISTYAKEYGSRTTPANLRSPFVRGTCYRLRPAIRGRSRGCNSSRGRGMPKDSAAASMTTASSPFTLISRTGPRGCLRSAQFRSRRPCRWPALLCSA